MPPRANRLVNEQSPYLLQHAANPVDWRPWGEEAFAAARNADKPLFVSIGYATCHWCHVMARESFEDEEIAAAINEWFVPVKVDREERPDVDGAFMAACIASTGSGGWPLTVFADAEGKPFFAGTYFPKETRGNRIGMRELLPRVAGLWRENRKEALATSARFQEALSKPRPASDATPDVSLIERGVRETLDDHDPERGGFGPAPKFPAPHRIDLLLRRWRRAEDRDALDAATQTLDKMILGGIHDRLGGGFHRYSTDAEWRLPHFEKMLYDQATISLALTDAWRATKAERYRRVAERTLDYVLRDLRDPTGAFHSAEDADSEGVEGKFYVWTVEEIDEALGEDASLAREAYDLKPDGNFFDPHGAAPSKANVLFRSESDEALAERRGLSTEALRDKLDEIDARLFIRREKRVRPLRDEKILLDWNGLMIAALARAGRAFAERRYVNAASDAAEFLLEALRDDRGEYLRRYKDGVAKFDATLDDYAFFAFGMLELYEATFDPAWLSRAGDALDRAVERLWDDEHGGFFFSIEREDVFFRRKEAYDGAIPSGASIAAYALARLGRMTGDSRRVELAEKTLRASGEEIERTPSQFAALLAALAELREPASELAIVGDDADEALDRLRRAHLPENATLWKNSETANALAAVAPFTRDMEFVEGKTRYFYCENNSCAAPTSDLDEALGRTERGPRSP